MIDLYMSGKMHENSTWTKTMNLDCKDLIIYFSPSKFVSRKWGACQQEFPAKMLNESPQR